MTVMVALATACVETTYARNRGGYGACRQWRYGKRVYGAHVLAWVDAHGRLPAEGMQINHHCDNRACTNVEHLYEGTQAQNNRDQADRGRSRNAHTDKLQCANGHVFDKQNTYVWNGERNCRKCRAKRERERRKTVASDRGAR